MKPATTLHDYRDAYITITVRRSAALQIRTALGVALIRLGARVATLGFKAEIEDAEGDPA